MSQSSIDVATLRRVRMRLLPLLCLGYIFAYLDRSNVGFAALQMNRELGFSPAVFGFGAGIFFLGYGAFEVPSNLILLRVGARVWMARIAISWGLLACLMMLVRTSTQFYLARFLLGVAEAGFFPAVIYYINQWFPGPYRARAIAAVLIGNPISQVLGGVLGGALLGLSGTGELSGWQWLFLIEGLPAILLGILVLRYLTEHPRDADWLSAEQRRWLTQKLDNDDQRVSNSPASPLRALANPLVWVLTLPYFALFSVTNGYISWAPTLVRDALGTSDRMTGVVVACISLLAAAVYPIAGKLSDRRGERCRWAALGLALQCAGCIGLSLLPNSPLRVIAVVLIPIGLPVFMSPFWCLPAMFLNGPAAAAGIALISTIGTILVCWGLRKAVAFKQAAVAPA